MTLRIAYVCADPGVPVFGRKGCSVHVQEILRALVRTGGARVELFASRFDGDPPRGLEHLVTHQLPHPPKGDLEGRERLAQKANVQLAVALERAGDFDLVYERYSLWSYAAMEWAAAASVPSVLEVNAPLIEEHARYWGLLDRAAAEVAARRCFTAAKIVAAVSEDVAMYARHHEARADRVEVIPNAVDPSRFDPLPAPALAHAADDFVVGFVGHMRPWHGLPLLVDCFARLHRARPISRLLLVGDGPERVNTQVDLAARGIAGAATFAGQIAHDAVPAFLRSMDAAIAPYPAGQCYFSPLKVFEYMAAGLPIVASEIGQLATVLEHDRSALLCRAGDAEALSAALVRLHDDPPQRARLGEAARTLAMTNYTWPAVASRVLKLAGLASALDEQETTASRSIPAAAAATMCQA